MLHDLLTARIRTDPGSPLITWYGEGGRREELSATTFANAVAKTAALLGDEWDLDDGTTVRLDLPLHWQAAVWLASCDVAGLTVVWDAPADLIVAVDPDPHPGIRSVAVSTAPFGLPGAPPRPGVLDHARDAMGQPDLLTVPPVGGAWSVAGDHWEEPTIRRHTRDLIDRAGERPLVHGPLTARTGLACWPLPLLGRSVVLLGDPTVDADATADAEQTTGEIAGEL